MAELTSRLHHAVVEGFLARGRSPSLAELESALGLTTDELRAGLADLEAEHGVVLDPATRDVWVIHPFSASPTLYWVARESGPGVWAPCAWCAFGAASMIGDCVITTRLAAERDLVRIEMRERRVVARPGLVVHFPVPIRKAWGNVHRFCATTLIFDGEADVRAWCDAHGHAVGAIVPIDQVAVLGSSWYAKHSGADWRKHSTADAQRIFEGVGLTGDFWSVEKKAGRF